MPPSTRPSSSQSSIHQHLKLHAPQHPAVKLAKQHPPAPQTACPRAPGRQARRPARKPAAPHPAVKLAKQHLPAPQTACPVAPAKQHPPAPQHPAVKLAKQHPPAPQTACPLAPGRQARKAAPTSTPNCMPPSTRPSSSQSPKLHAPHAP